MVLLLLFAGILGGTLAAMAAALAGWPVAGWVLAYGLGGAGGIGLGAAAAAAWRPAEEDPEMEDWLEAVSPRRGGEVVRLAEESARRRLPRRQADARLAPDWVAEGEGGAEAPRVAGWPEDMPEDLRLRLTAALDAGGAPDLLWDEIRGWLLERRVEPPEAAPRAAAREEGTPEPRPR